MLPSGPTPLDEVANAAFWFGLISALVDIYPNISEVMEFEDAKGNFFAAGRLGLAAQFQWVEGRTVPAQALICDELLPLARRVSKSHIDSQDIDRYLGVTKSASHRGRPGRNGFSNPRLDEEPRRSGGAARGVDEGDYHPSMEAVPSTSGLSRRSRRREGGSTITCGSSSSC